MQTMKKILIITLTLFVIFFNSVVNSHSSEDLNIKWINRTKYYSLALTNFGGFQSEVKISNFDKMLDDIRGKKGAEHLYEQIKDVKFTFKLDPREGMKFEVENYHGVSNPITAVGLNMAFKHGEKLIYDVFNIWKYYLLFPVIDEKFKYTETKEKNGYKLYYSGNKESCYYILDDDYQVKEFIINKWFLRMAQYPKFKDFEGKYLFIGYESNIYGKFMTANVDIEYTDIKSYLLPSKIIVNLGNKDAIEISFINHQLYNPKIDFNKVRLDFNR